MLPIGTILHPTDFSKLGVRLSVGLRGSPATTTRDSSCCMSCRRRLWSTVEASCPPIRVRLWKK